MDGDDRFSSDKASEVISQLYITYAGKMRRMAYYMLHDYHRAEDAVQNVFAAMLNNRENLKLDLTSKATQSYLCTAVRRTVYNLERDNKKYVLAPEDEDEDKFLGANDDTDILATVTKEELVSKIKMLPPQYSEVMLLRFIHNYTVKEVGEMLGINEALVRQRIRRGRIFFKKQLIEDGMLPG